MTSMLAELLGTIAEEIRGALPAVSLPRTTRTASSCFVSSATAACSTMSISLRFCFAVPTRSGSPTPFAPGPIRAAAILQALIADEDEMVSASAMARHPGARPPAQPARPAAHRVRGFAGATRQEPGLFGRRCASPARAGAWREGGSSVRSAMPPRRSSQSRDENKAVDAPDGWAGPDAQSVEAISTSACSKVRRKRATSPFLPMRSASVQGSAAQAPGIISPTATTDGSCCCSGLPAFRGILRRGCWRFSAISSGSGDLGSRSAASMRWIRRRPASVSRMAAARPRLSRGTEDHWEATVATAPSDRGPVRGRLDGQDRLISADPDLVALQVEAGSHIGSELALPQITAIARLARKLGVPIYRNAIAAGAEHDVELWVRATPEGDEVALLLERWIYRAPAAPRLGTLVPHEQHIEIGAAPEEWASERRPLDRVHVVRPRRKAGDDGGGGDRQAADPLPEA